jgi:hypothetical protein
MAIRTAKQAIANLARSAPEGSKDVENLLIEKSSQIRWGDGEAGATGRSAEGRKSEGARVVAGRATRVGQMGPVGLVRRVRR